MSHLTLDVSSVQGRLLVLDADDAPTQATIPFTLKVGIDSVRLIIGGEDGADVLVRKYTNRTSFVIHPDTGDPVAEILVSDRHAQDIIGVATIDADRMQISTEPL